MGNVHLSGCGKNGIGSVRILGIMHQIGYEKMEFDVGI